MVRSWLRSAPLALLLGACAEPKGVDVDPRALIPAGADVVFSFEVEAVKNSSFGPLLYAAALGNEDMRNAVTSLPSCPIDIKNMRVTFAGVMESTEERFMGVLESPGIGTQDNIKCLEREQAKVAGRPAPGWLMFSTRGDVSTLAQEGGGKLVILNKNTVVFMTAAWEEPVFAAIEQVDQRKKDTPLARAAAAIDAGTDAYLVVTLGDAHRAAMPELAGFDAADSVAVTGDLSAGIKLDLDIVTRTAAKAEELRGGIDGVVTGLKEGLEPMGLPKDLLDGTTTTAKDTHVNTKLTLGADALPKLIGALGPMFTAE
ncbi:MAG: hypothetical protein JNL82_39265 [Myxococcales bacterium]|nr:hypothetical protein [Myxococcales bacterium]